jgi:hypothetical protein
VVVDYARPDIQLDASFAHNGSQSAKMTDAAHVRSRPHASHRSLIRMCVGVSDALGTDSYQLTRSSKVDGSEQFRNEADQ